MNEGIDNQSKIGQKIKSIFDAGTDLDSKLIGLTEDLHKDIYAKSKTLIMEFLDGNVTKQQMTQLFSTIQSQECDNGSLNLFDQFNANLFGHNFINTKHKRENVTIAFCDNTQNPKVLRTDKFQLPSMDDRITLNITYVKCLDKEFIVFRFKLSKILQDPQFYLLAKTEFLDISISEKWDDSYLKNHMPQGLAEIMHKFE